MADCSIDFLNFNKSISLNKTDRKLLRAARAGITKKIKTYFKDNPKCPEIEFKVQGSFSMGTIIKPLDGEFDIDVGVYLKGYSDSGESWPKPETVSQWLINALTNHTSTPPINKKTCVRITYKSIPGNQDVAYHVDLPIYREYRNFWDNTKTRIGINGEAQWSQKSDPVGFTKWFLEKCKRNNKDKDQLTRIVKYIKAWKEHKKMDIKFPSGMALTILMANNYQFHNRDDVAFKETIRHSYNNLYSFFFLEEINSPVEPENDLLFKLTSKQKKDFQRNFEQLVDDAKKAIDEPEKENSLFIWRKHFDERLGKF